MKRPARLQAAKKWIDTFEGKNLLHGYCRHFAVDWRCAAIELARLGVKLDPKYLKQREATEAQVIAQRQAAKQKRLAPEPSDRWYDYGSMMEAYVAGDFEALHAMEIERDKADAEMFSDIPF